METAQEALAALNTEANVEKVEDLGKIVSYGVMMTPGLLVNGKLKASGRVPKKEEIKKWLQEENRREAAIEAILKPGPLQ
ncbi:MAG: thioredoxin family protein [Thermoanaerobacteraceae bacterium]|nr:thioredoxin family protein [Thermoanaerobacteraceae bacterium]